jgi:DNA adenine methylase
VYVEPCLGSGAVGLQKERARIEVWNDIDKRVVNFFQVLRDRPDELMRLINLTPFSRAELDLSYKQVEDPLENARRFCVLCWQSYGSILRRRTGWTMEKGAHNWKTRVEGWNDMEHLLVVARRLKDVQFECDDAIKVVTRWDTANTLYYIDLPYVKNTRSGSWQKEAYECDVPDNYHVDMANVLYNIKGMAIVSGYESEMYDELYKDWKKFSIQNRTTKTTTIKREVIWLNAKCYENGNQHRLGLINR